jgi:IclR family transcriptional regulator, pca regulon regulatory protein
MQGQALCSKHDICSICELKIMRKATDMLGSFAKGLSVIEAFSADRPRMSISDVALATGLDRATARRCLLTLTELGYADYDGKYFQLTPLILRLGTASLANMSLPTIVQPWLDRLSSDIGQSSSVSILDHTEIVYVARASRQSLMSISLMPGSRLPAVSASMGRVLLSTLPDTQLREILRQRPPQKRTEKSRTKLPELIKIIKQIRLDGFAIVDQELEMGLRSIAVPLYNIRGHMVGALNVGTAARHEDATELKNLYLDKLLSVQSALRPLLT